MEIGDEKIGGAETIAWRDEDIGRTLEGLETLPMRRRFREASER
jgi:hypothetical protein